MKGVTVKSLFNETWEVATTEQGTVGDVLEQLATADTRLAAAALLFRGRKLKHTVQVGDIISSSDDFLTLVMKRPKSSIQVNGSRQPWQRVRNLSDELENKHVRHRPEEARSEGPAGGADTPHEGAAHEPANPSRLGRRSGAQMVDHNGCASMPQEQQLPSGHYQQAGQEEYSNDKAGAGRPITPLEHATRASNADRATCSPSNTHAPSGNVSTNDGAAAAPHAAEPGEVDRMFEELQGELNAVRSIPVEMSTQGGTAEREAVPDARLSEAGKAAKGTPPAADSAAPKRNRRKSMKPRPSAKTGAQASAASQHSQNLLALPLPPPLQRLEDIFGALNTVYGFLLTQNIQATWHNMREATQQLLQQSEEPINPCVADIIAMNRLAPTVVVIRHQAIPVDGGAECDGSNEDGVFMIELRDGSGGARQDGIAQGETVLIASEESTAPDSDLGVRWSTRAGSALSSQKFSKAAFRRLAAAFRAALTSAVAAALSRRGFTAELIELLNEEGRGTAAGWPVAVGTAWEHVNVEEACDALASSAADPVASAHANLTARWWRRLSGHGPANASATASSGKSVCSGTQVFRAEAFLEHLKSLPSYKGQVCHVEDLPERQPRPARVSCGLSAPVVTALASRGISELFTHQAAAVDAALAGRHVVVSTSTASGKSLCYNIPIMQALAEDSHACALYLFPTKALAQDQLRALRALLAAGFRDVAPHVEVYDGDTPMEERGEVRDRTRLLVSNPDMLHRSVLPVHSQFSRFLSNLRYVVVDEGHYFGGIFGAHAALVLRRLRRVCERCYNVSPRFIVTSATMANPKSHAQELLGVTDVCLVEDDGAPRGSKSFVLWNPPLTIHQTGANKGRQKRGSGTDVKGTCDEGAPAGLATLKVRKRQHRSAPLPAVPSATTASVAATTRTDESSRDQAVLAAAKLLPETSNSKAKHLLRLEAERAVASVSEPAGRGAHRSSSQWFRRKQPGTAGHRTVTLRSSTRSSGSSVLLKGATSSFTTADVAALQERVEAKVKERASVLSIAQGKPGAPDDALPEKRRSPMVEIATLIAECVQHNVRTLAFCMTRKLCELVVTYARDILRAHHPQLTDLVAVYRSGYMAEDRREIERKLQDGRLRVVCATNAMELGVDVGELAATLHLGFPGSIASLWQQAGRAGRRGQHSLAIYVAFDGALDQYFMSHPQYLFGRPIEHNPVDARNLHLLHSHVVCAASEEPLHLGVDDAFFGPGLAECAEKAVAEGLLAPPPEQVTGRGVLHYVGKAQLYAATINLRTIDPNRILIVNEAAGGAVLEEVEECKAFWQVYPGAVYYNQGRSFLCKALDLSRRVATVRPADVKYYTKTSDILDIHVLGGSLAYPANTRSVDCPFTTAVAADAVVTIHWFQFHRIWMSSGKVFDTVPLHLPDMAYRTQAVYIRIPSSARQSCTEAGLQFQAGVHSASHAVLNVTPLYLTCGPADLGTECGNASSGRYCPERLLVYDKHPDGMGLVQQLHPLMGVLLQRALELVEACPCVGTHGCPSCVQHAQCGDYNTALDKAAARVVLQAVIREEVEPAATRVVL